MPFKSLFKKKSKPDLKSSKNESKFHNSEISRPIALPFPSSVSLHDIRDSLLHPIPDLHTRRRSKSTSTTASNNDKQNPTQQKKHDSKSPELFSKDYDPFAPPVPKIPAIFMNQNSNDNDNNNDNDNKQSNQLDHVENFTNESQSNNNSNSFNLDDTHSTIGFQYRNSNDSKLLSKNDEHDERISKTLPPKRPPRSRRPLPMFGVPALIKKMTNSPTENNGNNSQKSSPSILSAKLPIKGLGIGKKTIRQSVSDESFESLSIVSMLRSSSQSQTPSQNNIKAPPPRPTRSPPPLPSTATHKRSTSLFSSNVSRALSQIKNEKHGKINRKRSNSSPSTRNNNENKYSMSSLHSIPFSLQLIQPSSTLSSIQNARSSSGISINKENDNSRSSISSEQNNMINNSSSTYSSFDNSFDPSQFLNSYTKDESYTSFESLMENESKEDEIDKNSKLQSMIGSDFFKRSSKCSNDTNLSKKGNDVDEEKKKKRSEVFSSLEAVKRHMSNNSFRNFNDENDETDNIFANDENNITPPPIIDLRPMSPLNVTSIDEVDEISNSNHSLNDDDIDCILNNESLEDAQLEVNEGKLVNGSDNLNYNENEKINDIINDSDNKDNVTDDVIIDNVNEQIIDIKNNDEEFDKITDDSVSVYDDDDDIQVLHDQINAMAKKLEELENPKPSMDLNLDDHPELQVDLDKEFVNEYKQSPLPQNVPLPDAGPDEIELPQSPMTLLTSTDSGNFNNSEIVNHVKTNSENGSLEEIMPHSSLSQLQIANPNIKEEEEEEGEEEDNRVLNISEESRKAIQMSLNDLSKDPQFLLSSTSNKSKIDNSESITTNQSSSNKFGLSDKSTINHSSSPHKDSNSKPNKSKSTNNNSNRIDYLTLNLRDWEPTPLSPKISEENESALEESSQEILRDVPKRIGLTERNLNINAGNSNKDIENDIIIPPRWSSYKASKPQQLPLQQLEKEYNERKRVKYIRDSWNGPIELKATSSKSKFNQSYERKINRISQQPIDNSILPARNSSKAAKVNNNWKNDIENQLDSIVNDPNGDKRKVELQVHQQKTRAAMEAVWRAARSSMVPPVEQYVTPTRYSNSQYNSKKSLPILPNSAPATKTRFSGGSGFYQDRQSIQLPTLPSMKSFRESVENPSSTKVKRDQKPRPPMLAKLTPQQQLHIQQQRYYQQEEQQMVLQSPPNSFNNFQDLTLPTPPLTPGTASTLNGYDAIHTPTSATFSSNNSNNKRNHYRNKSASSMDSMSAGSTSSDNHLNSNKRHNLNYSSSAYSLKQESGLGYAV